MFVRNGGPAGPPFLYLGVLGVGRRSEFVFQQEAQSLRRRIVSQTEQKSAFVTQRPAAKRDLSEERRTGLVTVIAE
jgi:hypothetical protein